MIKFLLRDKHKSPESYRKENNIVGVVYGPDLDSKSIYIDKKSLYSLIKDSKRNIFKFEFDGKEYQGIIREVQKDPVSGQIIHFDIYVPSLERKVRTKVPIEFIGESPVIKKGGVLNFSLRSVEVEAFLSDLPDRIFVDVSGLQEIGQSIYVKDINLPKKVKILLNDTTVVVTAIAEIVSEKEEKIASSETTSSTTSETQTNSINSA